MARARSWLPQFVLAVSLLGQVAVASDFQEKHLNLVPFGGWTRFDGELKAGDGLMLVDDLYLGGRVGLRVASPVWLDLAGGYTRTTSHGGPATWRHLSANLLLVSSRPSVIQPFVSLGGGVSQLVPRWSADEQDGTFEAAAGFRLRVAGAVGLRLEARNVLLVPRRDFQKAHIDNVVLGAGLVLAFGGPEKDSDADGVPDSKDRCPGTPDACPVDARGCPMDSDDDGVCERLDRCPGTPRGTAVDAAGCAIDADGDRVLDDSDQCPDTPRGCTVDARGCPVDADGDGVCDGLDTCPGTSRRCKVDATGCPIDSDGDGVCDGLDQCPGTPRGTKVDPGGCPPSEVRLRETELLDTGQIRLNDINFATASADILPQFRHTLDVVGEVLARWPQLKIEIGGHCDARGSDEANLALSRRRVNSVRAYLLEHFPTLDAAKLVAVGYGESQPLVPNTSPSNMDQNRRVEFKVLNREVLQQIKR